MGNFTLSQNRYQNNYTNALHLGNQSGTLSNTELLYSFQNIATTQVAQQSIFNPVINNNNNNNNRNRSKANDRRKDKIWSNFLFISWILRHCIYIQAFDDGDNFINWQMKFDLNAVESMDPLAEMAERNSSLIEKRKQRCKH